MSKAKTPKPVARRVCMGASSVLLAVAVVGTGVLSTMASSVDAFVGTPKVQVTDAQKEANLAEASALAAQAEAEATVLLQNKDNTLPLSSDVKKSTYLAGLPLHGALAVPAPVRSHRLM